ncbi:hypothetical protein HPB50_000335 [Hyalomma asiaticum]|uniref:Uncharacterized protein n=1 Tax=Hyalomma asiaticum TaxID=266040 RepID=A0ACB7T4P7_HYAAI|nr:hypothetical protein HPB50_000335 [Hyalomma asiaticum]
MHGDAVEAESAERINNAVQQTVRCVLVPPESREMGRVLGLAAQRQQDLHGVKIQRVGYCSQTMHAVLLVEPWLPASYISVFDAHRPVDYRQKMGLELAFDGPNEYGALKLRRAGNADSVTGAMQVEGMYCQDEVLADVAAAVVEGLDGIVDAEGCGDAENGGVAVQSARTTKGTKKSHPESTRGNATEEPTTQRTMQKRSSCSCGASVPRSGYRWPRSSPIGARFPRLAAGLLRWLGDVPGARAGGLCEGRPDTVFADSDGHGFVACRAGAAHRLRCPPRQQFHAGYCRRPRADVEAQRCSEPDGVYPDYGSGCRRFFFCRGGRKTSLSCPGSLLFDWRLGRCRPAGKVACPKLRCDADGVFADRVGGCRRYFRCQDGEREEALCPQGQLFEAGRCQNSTSVECEGDNGCASLPDAFYPAPGCAQFVLCVAGNAREFSCPSDLIFSRKQLACDYPRKATCEVQDASCAPGSNGLFPLTGCREFAVCRDGVLLKVGSCPKGTAFDANSLSCRPAGDVKCTFAEEYADAECVGRPDGVYAGVTADAFYACLGQVKVATSSCPEGSVFDPTVHGCQAKGPVASNDGVSYGQYECEGRIGVFPDYRTSCYSYRICADGLEIVQDCGGGMSYDTEFGRCVEDSTTPCRPPRVVGTFKCPEGSPGLFVDESSGCRFWHECVGSEGVSYACPRECSAVPTLGCTEAVLRPRASISVTGLVVRLNDTDFEVDCGDVAEVLPSIDRQDFHVCAPAGAFNFRCPTGTAFDPDRNACDIDRGTDVTDLALPGNADDDFTCDGRHDGLHPDDTMGHDCARYYSCEGGRKRIMLCPTGTRFNPVLLLCSSSVLCHVDRHFSATQPPVPTEAPQLHVVRRRHAGMTSRRRRLQLREPQGGEVLARHREELHGQHPGKAVGPRLELLLARLRQRQRSSRRLSLRHDRRQTTADFTPGATRETSPVTTPQSTPEQAAGLVPRKIPEGVPLPRLDDTPVTVPPFTNDYTDGRYDEKRARNRHSASGEYAAEYGRPCTTDYTVNDAGQHYENYNTPNNARVFTCNHTAPSTGDESANKRERPKWCTQNHVVRLVGRSLGCDTCPRMGSYASISMGSDAVTAQPSTYDTTDTDSHASTCDASASHTSTHVTRTGGAGTGDSSSGLSRTSYGRGGYGITGDGIASTGCILRTDTATNTDADGTTSTSGCRRYHVCTKNKSKTYECPQGLLFSPVKQMCDVPEKVTCAPPRHRGCVNCKPSRTATSKTPSSRLHHAHGVPPGFHFACDQLPDGFYPDVARRCHVFYRCHGGQTFSHYCKRGLLFNAEDRQLRFRGKRGLFNAW